LQNVTTSEPEFQVVTLTSRVRVQPGQTVTHDVALDLRNSRILAQLVADLDGDESTRPEGVMFETVTFTADDTVPDNPARTAAAFSEQDGRFTVQLRPGSYVVTAQHTDEDGNTYSFEQTGFLVEPGQDLEDVVFTLVRE
ncbi:MAG TPA: hypothetical protein VM582_08795, partial [Candidatus Thermoplasmatota archaeon]|nr:hypothetical protein [Candidatus Thermoplasmatota archaeon]